MNKFNKTFKMIMESLDNKIDPMDIPDDILSQIHKIINSVGWYRHNNYFTNQFSN